MTLDSRRSELQNKQETIWTRQTIVYGRVFGILKRPYYCTHQSVVVFQDSTKKVALKSSSHYVHRY